MSGVVGGEIFQSYNSSIQTDKMKDAYEASLEFQSYNSSIQTCDKLTFTYTLHYFNPIIVRFKQSRLGNEFLVFL